MGSLRVACQTYTWEMLGDQWQGKVTDILDWVAETGYAGIEISNNMIGEFRGRPEEFAQELNRRGLQLAAFAYSTTGFTDPVRRSEDLAGARLAVEFARHFPRPRLGMGGAASPSGERTREKLDQAIRFYNEVGRMGAEAGVAVNVHPHSHHGSLLETAEEYQYLLDKLDPRYVSFGPDTGHIVRGGQDLLTCLRTHIARITHLHLKDCFAGSAGRTAGLKAGRLAGLSGKKTDANARREWVVLGQGLCDIPGALRLLESAGYDGWVVAEEESADAHRDGVAAIRKNRAYLRSIGY